MTTQNINATSSIFNNVHTQYNISHIHTGPVPTIWSNKQSAPLSFNDAPIDLLSVHFTGRKKELALIDKAFKQPRHNMPLRCVLFGNQGAGKSQLTYEWAKSTFIRGENPYIMWISATTVEKFYQGLCRLLNFVNHPDRSHPEQSVRLAAARRWFEEVDTGNWLLVLDNVFPETLDFLRQHLPRQNERGNILFTTRTERVAFALASTAGERHDVVEVPLLSVDDGVELFLGHFSDGEISAPSTKIESIVKSVGCLPLAISHAAAYMKQSRSTVDDMLDLYESKHKLDLISWENSLSEYEHKSVTATFSCQLQDLERQCPAARNLLSFLAFFDTENIPVEMLTAGAKAIVESQRPAPPAQVPRQVRSFMPRIKAKLWRRDCAAMKSQPNELLAMSPASSSLLALIQSPVELRNAITHLENRCLTAYQCSSRSPALRIHDLIQLVVLENVKKSRSDREFFNFAVELVCSAFRRIEDPELPQWWSQCELFVPHIQSLTIRQEISSEAKMQLLSANQNCARYLLGCGRYVEAEQLCKKVIAERERAFGVEDLDTVSVMYVLADVHVYQGRYNDAEKLFERVLRGRKKGLGPEHGDTLAAMYMLAVVYRYQERYDDAEELLKRTLQSQEKRFGSEHRDTLHTMHSLARVYHAQKRYDDSEALLKRVLSVEEKIFGSENVNTLKTMHELARVYQSQQRFDDAEAFFKRVMLAREKHCGLGHPETLTAKHCLADVYQSQGRYVESEALLVHVLARREETIGTSHPYTQKAKTLLALVYEKLGRSTDAEVTKRRSAVQPDC